MIGILLTLVGGAHTDKQTLCLLMVLIIYFELVLVSLIAMGHLVVFRGPSLGRKGRGEVRGSNMRRRGACCRDG